MEKEINMVGKMVTDTSPVNQPKGTTRFVLNGVNETEDGNLMHRFSEESNKPFFEIPEHFIPLGDTSINNEQSVVFYGNGVDSLIVIVGKHNTAVEIVFDDRGQSDKLGFSVRNQIDAIFRLRRGCERTIYWVGPKPRYFNLDRPEKFKNDLGEWEIASFDLQRRPKTYPTYSNISVLNSGGSLLSGSYNFLIQHLDEDLNPSEILSPTDCIKIYSDNPNGVYRQIRGSSNISSAYYNSEATTKAIQVQVANLDTSYPFFRVVIVEATSGTGLPTAVKYSSELPTANNTFIYTGNNFASEGSLEEVLEIQDYIEEARHIEQLDNMLILAETKGSQIPFCSLQKYFSKVLADMETKTVFLSENIGANSKNPTAKLEGLGYMPREIYSFGGVLLFEGNVQSPVYHIPGRSPDIPSQVTFLPGENRYPMDLNNSSSSEVYVDNSDCTNYWGNDAHGGRLLGEPIRHHRFPSRASVGLPLIEEVVQDTAIETDQFAITIKIAGNLVIPDCPEEEPDCDEDALIEALEDILFEITYTDSEGNEYTFIDGISYFDWDADGDFGQITIIPPITTDFLTLVSIKETYQGDTEDVTDGDPSPNTGLTYTYKIGLASFTTSTKVFKTEVMGIRFSNLDIPQIEETAGKKVVGVFFVRNERTENEMTVLDTGVLVPCLQHRNYISQGLLAPELPNQNDARLNKRFFGLINPRFKFFGTTYNTFSSIERDGSLAITQRNKSRFRINDVVDGTTYRRTRHKRSERDRDGWDLHVRTRHNRTMFSFTGQGTFADVSEIKDVFYLSALSSKLVEDNGTKREVLNLASDNKIGIVERDTEYNESFLTSLPYVSLVVDNANPYSNFRSLPYYKIHENYFPVNNGDTDLSFKVFGGDTYVTPMVYTNSVFYEDRARKRRTKSGIFAVLAGIVVAVAAAVIIITTGGLGAIAIAAIASAATALGSTLLVSGLNQQAYNRVYKELYKKGLRNTILDDFAMLFKGTDIPPFGDNTANPIDDEFQWIGDSVDLWFETTVNTSLRQGSNNSIIPDFIDAPSIIETGNDTPLTGRNTVPPVTTLDNHMLTKLTYFDIERKIDNRGYFGYAQAEIYDLNLDYLRSNKEKAYFALGVEYDCCSDCTEKFPHRVYYSLQSFDEELTDNYRVFLPNNYKDIEGNTGAITNLFRIGNNLYIHTKHALWHLPQNFQERVTGEILSFIGTGDYFSLPPRLIVDAKNNSAGTQHKWGAVKTPYGVSFPSSIEGVWYLFNGENLEPLSDNGMSNDFRNMMSFRRIEQHQSPLGLPFMFDDNPSNPLGVGYISVYDTEKKRLILTKKDYTGDFNPNSEYCYKEGQIIEFEDIETIIAQELEDDWQFIGVQNCELVFKKVVTEEIVQEGVIASEVPNDALVYVFPDYSGSFNSSQRTALIEAIESWYKSFRPDDTSLSSLIIMGGYGVSENWVRFPKLVTDHPTFSGKALIISLINEAHPEYHGVVVASTPTGGQPTGPFISDRNQYISSVYNAFDFIVAINYTIATQNITQVSKAHIQQSILAIKGSNFTQQEVDALPLNSVFTNVTEVNNLYASMLSNVYAALGPGLGEYGWIGKYDRNDSAEQAGLQDSIITPEQFATDLDELLGSVLTLEPYEYFIYKEVVEYKTIAGTPVEIEKKELGWTISYSLKEQGFISYHSYRPHYYLQETNKFFSWKEGLNNLYLHNVKGKYLVFYGQNYQFIVEKVENQSPMLEKITDFVAWQTIAQIWDEVHSQYLELKNTTFSSILLYNSYQISDYLTLVPKVETDNYLSDQITEFVNTSIIDRNERTWTLNNFRDLRINMSQSMFTSSESALPASFIDKIVNFSAISNIKPWYEMEPFRDKFLVVRYIFNNFTQAQAENVRLGIYFDTVDFKVSER